MFVFAFRENVMYRYALSGEHGLSKYYACTLVGDLDGICTKGSKKVVYGVCPVDHFRNDVEQQCILGGYKFLSISFEELNEWAKAKGESLGKTMTTLTHQIQNGEWTEENQNWLIFHFKHYAEGNGFYKDSTS